MQIIRTLLVISLLAIALGGCTIIRGAASGPSGETWYARQGYYTGKVKGIYYCPADGADCVAARIVDRPEYDRLTSNPTPRAEQ